VDRITIIGQGLIGGSLGMALKQAKLGPEVVGHDKDRGVATRAKKAGASDRTEPNLFKAVEGARMVVLAIPVPEMEGVLKHIGTELEEGCIVTDVGSTKEAVLRWAEEYLPSGISFVGGHPMAGKETSGPEGAQADLFRGATYCILPGKGADPNAVGVVVGMAEMLGAKPYFIDAVEHDLYAAAVSHLPMVLSTVLVKATSKNAAWPEIARLASSGYRDVSRLASGDPEMNRGICETNQGSLVRWIDEFIVELQAFKDLVREGGEPLEKAFDSAWETRDRWLQNKIAKPNLDYQVQLPSTAEAMGGMLIGDRAAGRVREMLEWIESDKSRRRRP
jgi:prephenate dehydrogenase